MFSLRYFLLPVLVLTLFASCRGSRKAHKSAENTTEVALNKAFATEYSAKLGIPVPENANKLLITNTYNWMGVPYKYGGNDKNGVDCSGLINNLYPLVYQLKVPRVSAQMHKEASPVEKNNLKEGDLVFFRINTREVGHAGIFLFGDYFVHASTSRGVIISRLSESYWSKYFVGGGRFSR